MEAKNFYYLYQKYIGIRYPGKMRKIFCVSLCQCLSYYTPGFRSSRKREKGKKVKWLLHFYDPLYTGFYLLSLHAKMSWFSTPPTPLYPKPHSTHWLDYYYYPILFRKYGTTTDILLLLLFSLSLSMCVCGRLYTEIPKHPVTPYFFTKHHHTIFSPAFLDPLRISDDFYINISIRTGGERERAEQSYRLSHLSRAFLTDDSRWHRSTHT